MADEEITPPPTPMTRKLIKKMLVVEDDLKEIVQNAASEYIIEIRIKKVCDNKSTEVKEDSEKMADSVSEPILEGKLSLEPISQPNLIPEPITTISEPIMEQEMIIISEQIQEPEEISESATTISDTIMEQEILVISEQILEPDDISESLSELEVSSDSDPETEVTVISKPEIVPQEEAVSESIPNTKLSLGSLPQAKIFSESEAASELTPVQEVPNPEVLHNFINDVYQKAVNQVELMKTSSELTKTSPEVVGISSEQRDVVQEVIKVESDTVEEVTKADAIEMELAPVEVVPKVITSELVAEVAEPIHNFINNVYQKAVNQVELMKASSELTKTTPEVVGISSEQRDVVPEVIKVKSDTVEEVTKADAIEMELAPVEVVPEVITSELVEEVVEPIQEVPEPLTVEPGPVEGKLEPIVAVTQDLTPEVVEEVAESVKEVPETVIEVPDSVEVELETLGVVEDGVTSEAVDVVQETIEDVSAPVNVISELIETVPETVGVTFKEVSSDTALVIQEAVEGILESDEGVPEPIEGLPEQIEEESVSRIASDMVSDLSSKETEAILKLNEESEPTELSSNLNVDSEIIEGISEATEESINPTSLKWEHTEVLVEPAKDMVSEQASMVSESSVLLSEATLNQAGLTDVISGSNELALESTENVTDSSLIVSEANVIQESVEMISVTDLNSVKEEPNELLLSEQNETHLDTKGDDIVNEIVSVPVQKEMEISSLQEQRVLPENDAVDTKVEDDFADLDSRQSREKEITENSTEETCEEIEDIKKEVEVAIKTFVENNKNSSWDEASPSLIQKSEDFPIIFILAAFLVLYLFLDFLEKSQAPPEFLVYPTRSL